MRTSFTTGEMSRQARRRVDLDAYHRGCSSVLNMIVGQLGGARRRRGMARVCDAISTHSRIFPFIYSTSDTLLLEFAPGQTRVLDKGVELWRGSSEWDTPEDIASINTCQRNDIVYIVSRDLPLWELRRKSNTEWELIESKYDSPPGESTGDGLGTLFIRNTAVEATQNVFNKEMAGRDYIIPTQHINAYTRTFSGDFGVGFTGDNDLTSYHQASIPFYQDRGGRRYWYTPYKSYNPSTDRKYTANADDYPEYFNKGLASFFYSTSNASGFLPCNTWAITPPQNNRFSEWIIQEVTKVEATDISLWGYRQRYDEAGISTVAGIGPSSTTQVSGGGSNQRWMRMILVSSRPQSNAGEEGNYTISIDGMDWTHSLKIITVTDEKHCTVDGRVDLGLGTPATQFDNWRFSAFGRRNGYPRTIAFHGNRMWLGGSDTQPQTVWASHEDDYYNFSLDANSAKAGIRITLASSSQNTIQWITSHRELSIGTTEGEWNITGKDGVIDAASISFRRQSSAGGEPLSIQADNYLIFLQRGGKRLRQYSYSFEADGWITEDLTLLADHILGDGCIDLAWQRNPEGVLWCVLKNGTCACLTYNSMQNVRAWSRIETAGSIKSIAILPRADGASDETWLVVVRNNTPRIEVIRDENQYLDDGQPYLSEIVTNSIDHPQAPGRQKDAVVVIASFDNTPSQGIEITNDGIKWTSIGKSGNLDGWVTMTAAGTWTRDTRAGIRTRTAHPLNIEAINIE